RSGPDTKRCSRRAAARACCCGPTATCTAASATSSRSRRSPVPSRDASRWTPMLPPTRPDRSWRPGVPPGAPSALDEAMLRAYTVARSLDYGVSIDDVLKLHRRVAAGAGWVATAIALAEDD